MDPNEALKTTRDALIQVCCSLHDRSNGKYCDVPEFFQEAEHMVESFQALDEWLSKGGFLPADWSSALNGNLVPGEVIAVCATCKCNPCECPDHVRDIDLIARHIELVRAIATCEHKGCDRRSCNLLRLLRGAQEGAERQKVMVGAESCRAYCERTLRRGLRKTLQRVRSFRTRRRLQVKDPKLCGCPDCPNVGAQVCEFQAAGSAVIFTTVMCDVCIERIRLTLPPTQKLDVWPLGDLE
jgi:hypothetical protein